MVDHEFENGQLRTSSQFVYCLIQSNFKLISHILCFLLPLFISAKIGNNRGAGNGMVLRQIFF